MALQLNTTIEGDQAVLGTLDELTAVLDDPTPLYEAAGQRLREYAAEVFETEGRVTGRAWAPHDPDTLERHGGGPLLQRTGRLRRSYTELGGDHIEDITPSGLEFGSRDRRAHLFDDGTGRMPARRVLAWPSDADRNRMLAEAFARGIVNALR